VERIFKEARVVVEAFDRAEEKAMLINVLSEKMPDTYIVAPPAWLATATIMKSERPGFLQRYSLWEIRGRRSAGSGAHGAESRNRCSSPSEPCFENPTGKKNKAFQILDFRFQIENLRSAI
jgi:hypothetical protein